MTQADHSKEHARNLQNPFSTPPATKVAQQVANKTAMQPLLYRLLASGQLHSSSSIQAEFQAVHRMCQT